MESLVSGLVGALIATILAILYNYITEQVRYRRELMIEIVEWADEVYTRISEMHVQKKNHYSDKTPVFTEDEYRVFSRETKRMVTSSRLGALTVLTYGEGLQIQKINGLQGELLNIFKMLLVSDKEKWAKINQDIDEKFKDIIEPLRASINVEFLRKTKVSSIIRDFIVARH